MKRPTIFCHMTMSLDGKIVGDYHNAQGAGVGSQLFYHEAFDQDGQLAPMQGWLSGRTTTDDNFTFYQAPDLEENVETVPVGDFIAKNTHDKFYFSVDPHGKLAWKSNELHYNDTLASVVEILTEDASNAYKAFLRRLNISYVIAGDHELDERLALDKLTRAFNLTRIMLGGGGVLNWSFIRQGLCDEVSIVLLPGADGTVGTPSIFMPLTPADHQLVSFKLDHVEQVENVVWLRYTVLPIEK